MTWCTCPTFWTSGTCQHLEALEAPDWFLQPEDAPDWFLQLAVDRKVTTPHICQVIEQRYLECRR